MACTQYAKLRYLSGSSLDPGEMFLTFSGVPAPCGFPRVLSNRRAHPAHIPEPRSWSLVSRESELHPAPAHREASRREVVSRNSGCAPHFSLIHPVMSSVLGPERWRGEENFSSCPLDVLQERAHASCRISRVDEANCSREFVGTGAFACAGERSSPVLMETQRAPAHIGMAAIAVSSPRDARRPCRGTALPPGAAD